MKQSIKGCLLEALRRYHSFHAGESPLDAWTGLGSPSEYRDAVKMGYMAPVFTEKPRVKNWYRLTASGLAVLLILANDGHRVSDYKITKVKA